jgi:hypothetical protein
MIRKVIRAAAVLLTALAIVSIHGVPGIGVS